MEETKGHFPLENFRPSPRFELFCLSMVCLLIYAGINATEVTGCARVGGSMGPVSVMGLELGGRQ